MDSITIRGVILCTFELQLNQEDGILKYPFPISHSSQYFIPAESLDVDLIRQWLHGLSNGKIISCRGRDIIRDGEGVANSFTNWEIGYAVKMNRRLFLLWDTEVESILIDGCHFLDQLHFECHVDIPAPLVTSPSSRVVIVCHGFCFEDGPNYLFVSALTSALKVAGYHVLVPDFRPR
jgi:hypothetical protein